MDNENINDHIFYLEDVFPDAEGLFTNYKKMGDSFKDALFVFDTNVLLLPYILGNEDLERLKILYTSLIDSKRLFIPQRVAREFANNRTRKLSETYSSILSYNTGLTKKTPKKFPILNDLKEKKELDEILIKLGNVEKELTKAVDAIKKIIRDWEWSDPISTLYVNLFTPGIFIDHGKSKEDLIKERDRRYSHKIPPGYKDSSKDDKGIGDLSIWLSILSLGQREKKDIIFVSKDNKPDWWHQSNGSEFLPRFELIDEYRRASEGKTIHICNLSKLLEYFEMDKDLIAATIVAEQEFKEKSTHLKLNKKLILMRMHRKKLFKKKTKTEQIEEMKSWFYSKYQDPADICPYESQEGGYIFIWGGPYDAREEIESEFGGIASEEVIDAAVSDLEEFCSEWSAIPHNKDEEPQQNINDLF